MSSAAGEPVRAATAPDAADPRLRTRTYAVPFEVVWQSALRLTGGGLRGWSTDSADDHDGIIHASTRDMTGAEHAVTVRIGLDENAQTVVQATVITRKAFRDFGRSRSRLRQLLGALDSAVNARHRHRARRSA